MTIPSANIRLILLYTCSLGWGAATTFDPDADCGLAGPADSRRVAGGAEESVGRFPWMASLGRREEGGWRHRCGGTLVSARHVLTAAHCGADASMSVLLGVSDVAAGASGGAGGTEVAVEAAAAHPAYDPGSASAYHDVAVVRLAAPVPPGGFAARPVCLPGAPDADPDSLAGAFVTLAGWGLEARNLGRETVGPLRSINLGIFPQEYCDDQYDLKGRGRAAQQAKALVPKLFTSDIICAGYQNGGIGSCEGDSGGPLVRYAKSGGAFRHVQVAVVSGGVGACGSRNFPGVYVRLTDPSVHSFVVGQIQSGSQIRTLEWTTGDGDNVTYTGETRGGQPHGQGSLSSSSGESYSGGFSAGRFDGRGTFRSAGGHVYRGEYRDGREHGEGRFSYPDGSLYEGEFSNGRMDGFGTYRSAGGLVYRGQYRAGKEHGVGTTTWPDGSTHSGGYAGGVPSGSGTYESAAGLVYQGGYSGGKEHGRGKLVWPDGSSYDGDFVGGAKEGVGTYRPAAGGGLARYEGRWEADAQHGTGTLYGEDGAVVYSGEWCRGERGSC